MKADQMISGGTLVGSKCPRYEDFSVRLNRQAVWTCIKARTGIKCSIHGTIGVEPHEVLGGLIIKGCKWPEYQKFSIGLKSDVHNPLVRTCSGIERWIQSSIRIDPDQVLLGEVVEDLKITG